MTTRITITQDGNSLLKWAIEDDDLAEQQVSAIVDVLNGNRPKRTRRRFTPEQLQEIADAWHAAPEGGRNKAVRDLLDVNSQDATNYISRCRAIGLIAPADRPVRPGRKMTSTVAEQSFDSQFGANIEALMARSFEK